MTDWNIQSRASGCEACGKTFAARDRSPPVCGEERGDFPRPVFCTACGREKFGTPRETPVFISCGQGVYQAPPPPVEAIKKETAETLLRKLIELNDPQYIPA